MNKKALDATAIPLVEQEQPGAITKEWIVDLAVRNYVDGVQQGKAEVLAYLKGSLGDNNQIFISVLEHFRSVGTDGL